MFLFVINFDLWNYLFLNPLDFPLILGISFPVKSLLGKMLLFVCLTMTGLLLFLLSLIGLYPKLLAPKSRLRFESKLLLKIYKDFLQFDYSFLFLFLVLDHLQLELDNFYLSPIPLYLLKCLLNYLLVKILPIYPLLV